MIGGIKIIVIVLFCFSTEWHIYVGCGDLLLCWVIGYRSSVCSSERHGNWPKVARLPELSCCPHEHSGRGEILGLFSSLYIKRLFVTTYVSRALKWKSVKTVHA